MVFRLSPRKGNAVATLADPFVILISQFSQQLAKSLHLDTHGAVVRAIFSRRDNLCASR